MSDLVTTGGSEMRAVTIAIQDWPNPLGILSAVSTAAMRRFRLVQVWEEMAGPGRISAAGIREFAVVVT